METKETRRMMFSDYNNVRFDVIEFEDFITVLHPKTQETEKIVTQHRYETTEGQQVFQLQDHFTWYLITGKKPVELFEMQCHRCSKVITASVVKLNGEPYCDKCALSVLPLGQVALDMLKEKEIK